MATLDSLSPLDPSKYLTPTGQEEALAALCHEQWANYMRYFLDNLATLNPPLQGGGLIVPGRYVAALYLLIDTAYANLSAQQQDNDRREAAKFLTLFYEWFAPPTHQPTQLPTQTLNYPSKVPPPTPME